MFCQFSNIFVIIYALCTDCADINLVFEESSLNWYLKSKQVYYLSDVKSLILANLRGIKVFMMYL